MCELRLPAHRECPGDADFGFGFESSVTVNDSRLASSIKLR